MLAIVPVEFKTRTPDNQRCDGAFVVHLRTLCYFPNFTDVAQTPPSQEPWSVNYICSELLSVAPEGPRQEASIRGR